MDVEAVREKQVNYLEALYDGVSSRYELRITKLKSALGNTIHSIMLQ